MKVPSVALITFGCAKNLVDSEVMLGHLGGAGYRFTADPSRADIIVLNTCGFIGPARAEAEDAIREALAWKDKHGARVIVTGCYSERFRRDLASRFPQVDAWAGVKDYGQILALVRGEDFRRGEKTFLYDHASPRVLSTPGGWAYLKVSEGCSHECAFCAIPLIKGGYRSRPMASIVAEAERLAEKGVREIILVSQDTTYYGRDKGRTDALARLLTRLGRVAGLEWIRFLYGYPDEVSEALLDALLQPKACRYLDIPFQHADPALAKRMRRTLSGPRALRLIERIRSRLPGAALRTSVIVGFPGEGAREFARLEAFVREARFDHLGVFTYWREEGTPAASLGDPVPMAVKERRRDAILEIQAGISAEKMKEQVGRTLDVLVDGPYHGTERLLVGRARSQAPEVDGVVFIDRPADWTPADPPIRPVEITSSDVYDWHGRFASDPVEAEREGPR